MPCSLDFPGSPLLPYWLRTPAQEQASPRAHPTICLLPQRQALVPAMGKKQTFLRYLYTLEGRREDGALGIVV